MSQTYPRVHGTVPDHSEGPMTRPRPLQESPNSSQTFPRVPYQS